jgi:cytoskeletal protein CcmA (bactofilin family)
MFGKKKQAPIKSLIAQGNLIEGHLHFSEGMRIDGEVRGDVRAHADASGETLLVVSETAHITGAVHAGHVIVNGRIDGPVFATDLLELQPKAQIHGDVQYRALEMHQGAVIAGQLQPMGQAAADKPVLKLAASNG